MHTKQAAYRTYVIGVRVPADSIPKALYWDTSAAVRTTIRKVFLSVQKYPFLETSIWTWTFVLDPKLGGKKMASEKAEKCAHLLCSCVTTSGKYCSAECEATVKTPEIACACPHAGWKGKTH
jgi:hypothetical protein